MSEHSSCMWLGPKRLPPHTHTPRSQHRRTQGQAPARSAPLPAPHKAHPRPRLTVLSREPAHATCPPQPHAPRRRGRLISSERLLPEQGLTPGRTKAHCALAPPGLCPSMATARTGKRCSRPPARQLPPCLGCQHPPEGAGAARGRGPRHAHGTPGRELRPAESSPRSSLSLLVCLHNVNLTTKTRSKTEPPRRCQTRPGRRLPQCRGGGGGSQRCCRLPGLPSATHPGPCPRHACSEIRAR